MSDKLLMCDPHAELETALMDEYVRDHGVDPLHLNELPRDEAEQLVRDAAMYACGRLCEYEARAHYVHELHGAAEKYR